MEKEEIISNDINLKITNYKNAKGVLINNLNLKKYKTLKECIYDLYGTIIYNSIDEKQRRRILYEYFKDYKYQRLLKLSLLLENNIQSFTDFCIEIRKCNFCEQIEDFQEFYEFYVHKRSQYFASFKNEFYAKNYSVFTPVELVKDLIFFNYEYYHFLLKEISEECGLDKVESIVFKLYFQIQDLYYDEKIFYKMDYKDILPLINTSTNFVILLNSIYNPEDIYYCFMSNLEEKFKEPEKINDLDRRALTKYHKWLEESK